MTNHTIWESLKAKFETFKNWLVRYSKIVLPVILVVCVALTIVIAIQANKRKVEQEETVVAPEEHTGEEEAMLEVPEVPLEKDGGGRHSHHGEAGLLYGCHGDSESGGDE